jgi:hypothetical protein
LLCSSLRCLFSRGFVVRTFPHILHLNLVSNRLSCILPIIPVISFKILLLSLSDFLERCPASILILALRSNSEFLCRLIPCSNFLFLVFQKIPCIYMICSIYSQKDSSSVCLLTIRTYFLLFLNFYLICQGLILNYSTYYTYRQLAFSC